MLHRPHACFATRTLTTSGSAGLVLSPRSRHADQRWGSRCSLFLTTLTVAPNNARGTWIQVWTFERRYRYGPGADVQGDSAGHDEHAADAKRA
jgi:hypothetical protein